MIQHQAIRIGNQSAASAARFLDPFEFALANNFEAFEWFPDRKPDGRGWDGNDLDAAKRTSIRKQAQAGGIRQSVHARWTANPLRTEALPLLFEDLDLAEDLGASLLNLHLFAESGAAAYAGALAPLLRRAGQSGMQIAIENTPETTSRHFNDLFAALPPERGGRATVGMCFDLGHANLCGATRNDYLAYLDQLDPRVPIIHLHVHENRGDADSHLPLFTGPAAADDRGIRGFIDRLRRRRYQGSLILEQWPEPPSLLNQARDRLRLMLT